MPSPTDTPERFTRENDYTLSVETRRETRPDSTDETLKAISSVTRSFNFQSQQVTTTTREYIHLPSKYQGGSIFTSGSAGVAVASFVQNFEDIQSPDEIARFHGRLVAFGGHPPALDTLQTSATKGLIKGPAGLAAGPKGGNA